jgi:16S rRNA (cytidine1402-2'-O)-methyltransferase
VDRELVTGTLYVVATPLGNLADLSPRAADTLRGVGVVAAEDTRRTRTLLTHLGARARLLSYHAHSDEARADAILALLEGGTDVALVTDAGTPTVSDPGAALTAAARARGMGVVVVPGPSAVTAALSGSGLPADRYTFVGFLPRKGPDRRAHLAAIAASEVTVVVFESANRLAALLADLATVAGEGRGAVVARELTKLHEEFRAGTLGELAGYYSAHEPRGEVTLVIAGAVPAAAAPPDGDEIRAEAARLLAAGFSRRDAARQLAETFGIARNAAYQLVGSL